MSCTEVLKMVSLQFALFVFEFVLIRWTSFYFGLFNVLSEIFLTFK